MIIVIIVVVVIIIINSNNNTQQQHRHDDDDDHHSTTNPKPQHPNLKEQARQTGEGKVGGVVLAGALHDDVHNLISGLRFEV